MICICICICCYDIHHWLFASWWMLPNTLSVSNFPAGTWLFVFLLFCSWVSAFQLYHDCHMMYEMRRRKQKPTLKGSLTLVWEELDFDEAYVIHRQLNVIAVIGKCTMSPGQILRARTNWANSPSPFGGGDSLFRLYNCVSVYMHVSICTDICGLERVSAQMCVSMYVCISMCLWVHLNLFRCAHSHSDCGNLFSLQKSQLAKSISSESSG